jgi:sec-independent protein translocase protein TatC
MAPGDMFFIEHLNELRTRFLRVVVFAIAIVIITSVFGIQLITVNNFTFYFLYPSIYTNISSETILFLSHNLLPSGVKLIQTAPGQSLFAQIYVSFLLSLAFTIPLIVKELFGFISPAISSHSKKISYFNYILPIFGLFLAGIIFSFLVAIPIILKFLYQYGQSLGILSFLTISEFINFVLQFFIAFGISFQLPLVMYILSLTGLIDNRFWIKNFKYALILIIIFGAFITPDGSGLTMWFVSIPMILLYTIGILAIKINSRKASKLTRNNQY